MSGPFLRTLAGEVTSPPPIWLMRQAGRYLPEYRAVRAKHPDFIAFCFNAEAAAEVTLQPIRRYDFDAAIVFADILLLPHVVGATVTFTPGDGPSLAPLEDPKIVDRLSWDQAVDGLAPVMDTLGRVRSQLAADKALIGFAGGPWTVATYMLGGGKGDAGRQRARTWGWTYPDAMDTLLARLADATADYLAAQIRAGADVVKVFESWAEGLAPPLFERWVVQPTQRIITRLRDQGVTAPVIGFPRGAPTSALMHYAPATGVTALALDMAQARSEMASAPSDLILQGGLDPALLVAGGSALVDEIHRLLDLFAGRPYVFNLGHGIWPHTPLGHMQTLVDTVRGGR